MGIGEGGAGDAATFQNGGSAFAFGVFTTLDGVAGIGGAFAIVVAIEWLGRAADARLTGFIDGTSIGVVASGAVGCCGIGTGARGFVARAYDVALIGGATDDGVAAGARACIA